MDVLIELSNYFSDTAIFITAIDRICKFDESHGEGYTVCSDNTVRFTHVSKLLGACFSSCSKLVHTKLFMDFNSHQLHIKLLCIHI